MLSWFGRRAFGIAERVFRAIRLPAYVPEERFVSENHFSSISLPLGISIAVGRGRAVSGGQRNWGRCCTLQPHYSFATGSSLHSAELGVACVLKQGVGGLSRSAAQSARRREPQRFARRRSAAAAVS